MSNRVHIMRRPDRANSGGALLNVVIFIVGSIAIVATVIYFTGCGGPDQDYRPSQDHPEDFTPQRGEGSGGATGGGGDTTGARPTPIKHPANTSGGDVKPAEPKYIGDTDFKKYHLPDCKVLKSMDASKKVPFYSADEAFAAGYVPCKICNPPRPSGTDSGGKYGSPADLPVVRAIKDVNVPFPFKIVESTPDVDKGVVRVDVIVELDKVLDNNNDIYLMAQKMVAMETAKRRVSAVTVTMRNTDPKTKTKWVCEVDWAPFGDLMRASDARAGDYQNHKFKIFMNMSFRK